MLAEYPAIGTPVHRQLLLLLLRRRRRRRRLALAQLRGQIVTGAVQELRVFAEELALGEDPVELERRGPQGPAARPSRRRRR